MGRPLRVVLASTLPVVALAATLALVPSAASRSSLPPVGHVFVIVLENESYASTFGDPAADPYLARTLPSKGALLTQYYGTGHESNDNYIAMVSGQGPNPQTQADCQIYDDFVGTGPTAVDGQAVGQGCVYPAAGADDRQPVDRERPHLEGLHGGHGQRARPRVGDLRASRAQQPGRDADARSPATGTSTRHDPFVYFHSIIDDPAYCDAHVVPLTGARAAISPAAVDDAEPLLHRPEPLRRRPRLSVHERARRARARWPTSTRSSRRGCRRSRRRPRSRRTACSSSRSTSRTARRATRRACCNETPGPNTPLPGITGLGGGRVGAVLLSPFIRRGTVSSTPYNHYSLLGVDRERCSACRGSATPRRRRATFGSDVFNR